MSNLLKAIVVDDEPIIIEQFKKLNIWEEHNFILAECFSSAEDAEEYMQENIVDVVLCDIKLPVMSGIEFAEIVKEEYPQTMMVLMSAYSEFEYAQQAIAHGVKDYLVKPLTKKTIANCLDKLYKSAPKEILAKSSQLIILQQILTSVVTGNIDSKDNLTQELLRHTMPESFVEHPVIFLNVHISNLENYLNDSWQYGRTRLYNAISFILNQSVQQFNLYLTRYCDADFECAAISKSKVI